MEKGHQTINFGDQEVEGRGHTRIWRSGECIILDPLGSSGFSSFRKTNHS